MCLLICFRITEVCECILLCCGRSVLCRDFYLKAVVAFLIKYSKIDSYRTFLYKDVIGNIMIGDHTEFIIRLSDNVLDTLMIRKHSISILCCLFIRQISFAF